MQDKLPVTSADAEIRAAPITYDHQLRPRTSCQVNLLICPKRDRALRAATVSVSRPAGHSLVGRKWARGTNLTKIVDNFFSSGLHRPGFVQPSFFASGFSELGSSGRFCSRRCDYSAAPLAPRSTDPETAYPQDGDDEGCLHQNPLGSRSIKACSEKFTESRLILPTS